mgnify:CR=1 FL=1
MSENHSKENRWKKQAAALRYHAQEDPAPRIIGLGQGFIAEKMLQTAEEQGVAVVKDPELSQVLQHLEVGDDIPPELYQVVAEILMFVAKLDGDQGKRFGVDGYLRHLK